MRTHCIIDDRQILRLPLEHFAHSAAANPNNSFDSIGVLHNALVASSMSAITEDLYRGINTNGNRIFESVTKTVNEASSWDVNCYCVKEEGCPCLNILTWIRDNFSNSQVESDSFPRNMFSEKRPDSEFICKLARKKFGSAQAVEFLKFHDEFREILNSVQSNGCRTDTFQRDVVSLEERVLTCKSDSFVKQTLLITLAVARHSMYFAAVSGQPVSAAPGWVGDDADGATAGAITGSLGGPVGAVKGAAIGAAIFSLATATGWW